MSNFPALDDFDNDFTKGGGTNDFLARERELLGDDAAQFGGAPSGLDAQSSANDEDDFLNMNAPTPSAGAAPGSRFDVSSFEREAAAAPSGGNMTITGNDEMSAFESQFPELETSTEPQQSSGYTNGFGGMAPAAAQPAYPPTQSSIFPPAQAQEPESEAITAWRERQQAEIKRRDDEAEARKEDTISRAERQIDDFYKEYNAKKEKQIAKNKEEEAKFLNDRTDALAKGTTWERIALLIDLQDSRSKTNSRSTRDLSRMKEVLLNLKREGDSAPGAAGY